MWAMADSQDKKTNKLTLKSKDVLIHVHLYIKDLLKDAILSYRLTKCSLHMSGILVELLHL
uniref:Uncharacterized protein n=1 Tax=Peronospora matthiolae TaxID=2874970 RepID=A0AAV1TWM0_9STRA